MKSTRLFYILLAFVVILGIWWSFRWTDNEPTACPTDAVECPDGSLVGRTEPSCTFAPCPEPISSTTEVGTDGWTTYRNLALGFSIRYPSHWYYKENNGVIFTSLAPEDPKRRSSTGLASSLTIKMISADRLAELKRLATTTEEIKINATQGTLLLTPNAYAGGFNRDYVFPLSGETYLQVSFYGEGVSNTHPFKKMVETLQLQ